MRATLRVTAVLLSLVAPALAAQEPTYVERFRPQFHFTPAVNWMNDPNGLVWYGGEYHLFYQYNPFGSTWGHMSWGHAVSSDLVRWRHLPVAIPEVGTLMAFSGSAVVDWKNTSGFGRGGAPPLVAVYTGHREGIDQAQHVAYSTDRGRTWTPYAGNPVIDIGSRDFRDPKVFWHAPGQKWVMVVALSPQHRLRLYESRDLKAWTPLSEFGPAGATGGIWECPDLFPLAVDGDPRRTKWVLVVNMNPGGPAGGSAAQYFVGDFDGTRFTPDGAPDAAPLWVDHGMDFYAAVTWSDVPKADGRRLMIGWMNAWQYAEKIPTHPWRSAQSVPRALSLVSTPDGPRLVQQPVRELATLRTAPRRVGPRAVTDDTMSLAAAGIRGAALDLEVELDLGDARTAGLVVRRGAGEGTVIGVDRARGELYVDRTRAGDASFSPVFAARHVAPLRVAGNRVRLRVLVDWSSVEVFADGGRAVLTDQVFPRPESDGVALFASGGTARATVRAWRMRSAWAR